MNSKTQIPLLFSIILVCCLTVFPQVKVGATEKINVASAKNAVVFLLDSSNSMNSNDRNRLAKDSIAQLIYSLPSNYLVGFVAYNTDVVAAVPLQGSDQRQNVMTTVNNVKYIGYTNAGAGLAKALEVLETNSGGKKTVVILSDGEIIMQNDSTTAQSSAQFQTAMDIAKNRGIQIHVIGLGPNVADNANTIFSAAEFTSGAKYHAPKATDIQNAIDAILLDQLGIKKTTVATVDTDGGLEELNITIPSHDSAKVRILFTSNIPIRNLNADFNAGSVRQFNGTHYTLIELEHPTAEQIHVKFQGQEGGRVKVDMITEYALKAKVDSRYIDTEPKNQDATHYNRIAQNHITFYDAENPERQVLNDLAFHGLSTPLLLDGEPMEASLQNGTISFQNIVTADETHAIEIDLSKLETNIVYLEQPIQISLKGSPLLPVPTDYSPHIIVGVVVSLGLIVGLILWNRARQRNKPKPIPEVIPPQPTSKFNYTGRLSIYITHTQSGYDIPPLTYNLFRLPGNKVLSLQEVLDSCNVEEQMEGAERIFFKPGAGRCLVLTNNSDCTLMQNREILMKNRSYQICTNSKVDITFEDEVSELVLQYRDVKPSDMRLLADL